MNRKRENHSQNAAVENDICIIGDASQTGRLASKSEVLALLRAGESSFTDLAPIRRRYEKQFEDEQFWNFPFCDGSHPGGVFLPVQEGVLYLPYDRIYPDCYEQFELEDAHLMDSAEARRLLSILEKRYASLSKALQKTADQGTAVDAAPQPDTPRSELESVLAQKEHYIRMMGYPVTERLPINDISRKLIQAMAAVHGAVYLGTFFSDQLIPYTGQAVCNFQYNFCVPIDSEPLKAMLRTGLTDYKVFDAFYQLLRSLDGHCLFWA